MDEKKIFPIITSHTHKTGLIYFNLFECKMFLNLSDFLESPL